MTNTKTIVAALALGAALALSGCGDSGAQYAGTSRTGYDDPIPFDAPPIDEATKKAYLDAINAARSVGRNCGNGYAPPAPPLQWSDALYRAAYEHSQDMAATGVLTHDGSGTETDWTAQVRQLGRGSTFDERVKNNGAVAGAFGENAALDGDGLNDVIILWLNSPGHCMNLMSPGWKYAGMARVGAFWTQEFTD